MFSIVSIQLFQYNYVLTTVCMHSKLAYIYRRPWAALFSRARRYFDIIKDVTQDPFTAWLDSLAGTHTH